jgi:hypothetical protein
MAALGDHPALTADSLGPTSPGAARDLAGWAVVELGDAAEALSQAADCLRAAAANTSRLYLDQED